jgi:hypothetical protein
VVRALVVPAVGVRTVAVSGATRSLVVWTGGVRTASGCAVSRPRLPARLGPAEDQVADTAGVWVQLALPP